MPDLADDESKRTLLEKLRAKREGYESEMIWHRFLIDAYTGCGGFAGRVRQPEQAFLGWAAEVYSDLSLSRWAPGQLNKQGGCTTYLDRHPREDEFKFARRRAVAHYSNYVEPILSTLTSYVTKRGFARKLSTPLEKWAKKVDGTRSWDAFIDQVVIPRSALLGWTPVMFDQPKLPDHLVVAKAKGKRLSRADTDAAGIQPRAIPLFPANVFDWAVDDSGKLLWAKIVICEERRADPLSPLVKVEKYYLLERDQITVYTVTETQGQEPTVSAPEGAPNDFGAVPLVSFTYKPNPEHPVLGIGMMDGVAIKARRLFNIESEFDEHIGQCAFAMLQVPGASGVNAPPAEFVIGGGQGLYLPHSASHEYKWVGPPGDIAATFENRIERLVMELYRIARDQYEVQGGGQAESGIARAYAFEPTNRKLGDFAKSIATTELDGFVLVATALGVEAASDTSVTAPTDFRTEDIAAELANATLAKGLELPPTAMMILLGRLVDKLLPNLPEAEKLAIEAEFEDLRTRAEQRRSEADEMHTAERDTAVEGEGDEGGGDAPFAIGDRVRVKSGKAHDDMTADSDGTVRIVEGTALGVEFDAMPGKNHKWYVAAELEAVGSGHAVAKRGKKGKGR